MYFMCLKECGAAVREVELSHNRGCQNIEYLFPARRRYHNLPGASIPNRPCLMRGFALGGAAYAEKEATDSRIVSSEA